MRTKQSKNCKKQQTQAPCQTKVPEGGAAPPPQPKATPKQQAFARHYLACQNPTQAALLAGYAAQRAPHTGTKLLALAGVQALLHRAKAEACGTETHKEAPGQKAPLAPGSTSSERQTNTGEPTPKKVRAKTVREPQGARQGRTPLPHSATSDEPQEITGNRVLRELAAIGFASMSDFCHWSTEGIELLHSGKLSKEQTAAIAEISESSTGKGAVRIKTHAKLKALEMLGRHLGIFGAESIPPDKEDPCGFSLPEDLARQLDTILPNHTAEAEENDEHEGNTK